MKNQKYSNFSKYYLFGILALIFVMTIIFYPQLKHLSQGFVSSYGLFGMILIIIIMDTVIQPISPDLVVFTAALAGFDSLYVYIIGGLASCLAGVFGYFLGRKIGAEKFKEIFGHKHLNRGRKLFSKYGPFAVVVGAVSPIPYSAVCWSAGICGMSFLYFVLVAIVSRVPRFLIMGMIGGAL